MSASTPIRIDDELLQQATAEGARQRRSATKQVEFWAELGRAVSGTLSIADVVAIRSGLLRLEANPAPHVDPDELLAEVESRRGTLAAELPTAGPVYQSSSSYPGYLEQVHPDGRVVVGHFVDGEFQARVD